MARKQSRVVLQVVMAVSIVIGAGFTAFMLMRPSRLTPLLQNINGKLGIRYQWLGEESLLVCREEDSAYLQYNLQTGAETALKWMPVPRIGQATQILTTKEGKSLLWEKARDLEYPPPGWATYGDSWYACRTHNRATSKKSELVRVSWDGPSLSLQSFPIPPSSYSWLGVDARKRFLAIDQEATVQHQGGKYMEWDGSGMTLVGPVKHLTLAAFPMDSAGRPFAPGHLQQLQLRIPPGIHPAVSWSLSPDGTKVAWMTHSLIYANGWEEFLPGWLSRTPRSDIQFWISDLSDTANQNGTPPRLVYALPWDTGRKPISPDTGRGRGRDNLQWTPDGKSLSYLHENTLWRLQIE